MSIYLNFMIVPSICGRFLYPKLSIIISAILQPNELEKEYDDPISFFSNRVEQLKEEKKNKKAPMTFVFYNTDKIDHDAVYG